MRGPHVANTKTIRDTPGSISLATSRRATTDGGSHPTISHYIPAYPGISRILFLFAGRVSGTSQRERQMRRFKSAAHVQRFASVPGRVQNLFRVGRHLVRAVHHRLLRTQAFGVWREVTCV